MAAESIRALAALGVGRVQRRPFGDSAWPALASELIDSVAAGDDRIAPSKRRMRVRRSRCETLTMGIGRGRRSRQRAVWLAAALAMCASPVVASPVVASPVVASPVVASPVVASPVTQTGPSRSAACVANANLVLGTKAASVSCLQFTLALLGYYPGEMTGVFDTPTSTAVAIFQAESGLESTGRGDEPTLTRLGVYSGESEPDPLGCFASADIKPDEEGDGVRCMQRALQRLGFYSGDATGENDSDSVAALKEFQRARGIGDDGVGGPVSLAALDIWSGKVSVDPAKYVPASPTPGVSGPLAPDGPWPAGQQSQPFWNLSAEGIPYYGNRGICSRADANTIAAEFAKDRADIETQQFFAYIASRETGCRYDGVNINPRTRDDSHCAFQINALAGVFEPTAELGRKGWTKENIKASMQACADAASDLWVFCGRGPWLPPYYCRPPWND